MRYMMYSMADAPTITPTNSPGTAGGETIASLITEVSAFQRDCEARYHFNSRWDNVLNVTGIALSVAIVAAGTFRKSEIDRYPR